MFGFNVLVVVLMACCSYCVVCGRFGLLLVWVMFCCNLLLVGFVIVVFRLGL